MSIPGKIFTLSLCLLLSSCTEPGETTAVGAATGGVIGAGLGAIVGNQTGSAGAGLVLGGVAGAAAGAAVGNAIEAQEETIRTQDEAIERQENLLAAQKAELRELRALGQDSVSFRGGTSAYVSGRAASPGITGSYRGSQPAHSQEALDLQERNLLTAENSAASEGVRAYEGGVLSDRAGYAGEGSTECLQADDEARSAAAASGSADKLLHLRRALRLCPGRPSLHVSLGRVYRELNRKADADFEFKEALRLDPGNQDASSALAAGETD